MLLNNKKKQGLESVSMSECPYYKETNVVKVKQTTDSKLNSVSLQIACVDKRRLCF